MDHANHALPCNQLPSPHTRMTCANKKPITRSQTLNCKGFKGTLALKTICHLHGSTQLKSSYIHVYGYSRNHDIMCLTIQSFVQSSSGTYEPAYQDNTICSCVVLVLVTLIVLHPIHAWLQQKGRIEPGLYTLKLCMHTYYIITRNGTSAITSWFLYPYRNCVAM